MKTFKADFLISYADTDAGGVVYHSRYIDMAERARMEMLHELGISCRDLEKAEKLSVQTGKKAMELIRAKGKASDNRKWSDVVKKEELQAAETTEVPK